MQVTPERWQEIQKIFAEALGTHPSERGSYLSLACTDVSLRRDVELMIAAHEHGDRGFLEPASAGSGEILKSGTRIGPYEVLAPLGAGGMGEVYRARDTRLGREVAIKVLPEVFARDPQRRERFRREARFLASLNHANIAAIYGVEDLDMPDAPVTDALVMELAEGPTLAERIRSGAIPVREALPLDRQIADALEYAHERGIVHRDLKPANIKISRQDSVKVLDFGLAKAVQGETDAPTVGDSPTLSEMATRLGVLLGTAAYMSPEQAKSKPVDRRADIWAFGCVLYEMLTGKKAFPAETVTETLAAVLNHEPDWSKLPYSTPKRVRALLKGCLQKDPKQRLRDIGDARISLDELLPGASQRAVAALASLWPWILATAGVMVVAAGAVWLRLPPAVPVVESITQITDDGEPKVGLFTDGPRLYFNEEGARTHIVQVSVTGGRTGPVENSPSDSRIEGITPDGGEMLLLDDSSNVLALPLPAGQPRRLFDGQSMSLNKMSLLPDGRIIFSTHDEHWKSSDLVLAEKDGRDPKKIASFNTQIRVFGVSSDGERILICAAHRGGCTLRSIRKDGSDESTIMEWHGTISDGRFRFSHDEKFVLFDQTDGSQSDIWAYPLKASLFHHSSVPIRLTSEPLSYTNPLPSSDGRRIFAIGTKAKAELVRFEPKTGQLLSWRPGLSAIQAQFSADGKWMVYVSYPDLCVWRSRVDGSQPMQLTYPPMKATSPRFSPDGDRIAFTAGDTANTINTYLVDISGAPPRKIADTAADSDWSPDGSKVAINAGPASLVDLASGKVSHLPGGQEKAYPMFLDRKTLVAWDFTNYKFVTFDLSKNKWSDLVSLPSGFVDWELSPDRKLLYYLTGGKEPYIGRIALSTKKLETVGKLTGFHPAIAVAGSNFAVLPDGSFILSRDISSQEIYALNMRWP